MTETRTEDEIRNFVRDRYGEVAECDTATQSGEGCGCAPDASSATVNEKKGKVSGSLGYSKTELASLPEGADMGLSCGNPVALALVSEGETFLDLGSGGGFDCFIAGPKVGPTGRVIGVDMTPAMISKARAGVTKYRERTGLDNVEFRLGEIEHLPVADASVDAVISNCVLNLSPDKPQVWRDIARALKPGGRVAVSDIALLKPLPKEIADDLLMLSGCISGAVTLDEYTSHIEAVGLTNIRVEPKPQAGDVWDYYNDPLLDKIKEKLPAGIKMGDYAVSVNVTAIKPGGDARAAKAHAAAAATASAASTPGGCCG